MVGVAGDIAIPVNYARSVGHRQPNAVKQYAKAHRLRLSDSTLTAAAALAKADLGEDTATALSAVAERRGLTPTSARNVHYPEVARTRDLAVERAAANGTTVWTPTAP